MISDDAFNEEWYRLKDELGQAVREALRCIQETGRIQWPKLEVKMMLEEIISEML